MAAVLQNKVLCLPDHLSLVTSQNQKFVKKKYRQSLYINDFVMKL